MSLNLPWHQECHPGPSSTQHGRSHHRCCAVFPPCSVPHVEVWRTLVSCTLSPWLCWGHSAAKVLCSLLHVGSLASAYFIRSSGCEGGSTFLIPFWLKDSPWGQAGCLTLRLQIAKFISRAVSQEHKVCQCVVLESSANMQPTSIMLSKGVFPGWLTLFCPFSSALYKTNYLGKSQRSTLKSSWLSAHKHSLVISSVEEG